MQAGWAARVILVIVVMRLQFRRPPPLARVPAHACFEVHMVERQCCAQADAVFMSPPWGGPAYAAAAGGFAVAGDLGGLRVGLAELLASARRALRPDGRGIAVFLPRNTLLAEVTARSCQVISKATQPSTFRGACAVAVILPGSALPAVRSLCQLLHTKPCPEKGTAVLPVALAAVAAAAMQLHAWFVINGSVHQPHMHWCTNEAAPVRRLRRRHCLTSGARWSDASSMAA